MAWARRIGILLFAAGICTTRPHSQEIRVDDVLNAAAEYLQRYERAISGVVAEESYAQGAPGLGARTLRSDVLFLGDEALGWIEFRDVFSVDGQTVRDRQQRVLDLFANAAPDRLEQARRIVAEGARFNLASGRGRFERTLNLPLTALRFLRAREQRRSTFTLASRTNSVVELRFQEHERPRLIQTPSESPASGWFRVEPATGRVIASRLELTVKEPRGVFTVATFSVTFADDAKTGLLLPKTMNEGYRGAITMTGRAEYSNFRQFRVQTNTDVGIPK